MSNQVNHWKSFAVKQNENYGNTNKAVGGGSYLNLGNGHQVEIESVSQAETQTGIPYIKLGFKNEVNQRITSTLFLLSESQDGEKYYSKKYRQLASSLVSDKVTRFKLFNVIIPNNPSKLLDLVGMKLLINVEHGKKGVSIEDLGGTYKLMNLESKEFFDFDGGVPNEFGTYGEAIQALKNLTVGGYPLKRAFNEVSEFTAADDTTNNDSKAKEIVETSL